MRKWRIFCFVDRLLLGVALGLGLVAGGSVQAQDKHEHYQSLVTEASEALGVHPRLIVAIMITESNLNPAAVSPKGAVGLMQLMPAGGAREAYRFLYGKDATPTAASLLEPELNIWFGTAYLVHLDQYFSWVEDPFTRLLAVVASYNWGPTNVSRVIVKKESALSAQEFMARVLASAPKETQQYVYRVIGLYRS